MLLLLTCWETNNRMLVRMEEDEPATDKERLGPPATDRDWDPNKLCTHLWGTG